MKVGVGGSKLVQCQLGNTEILPTKVERVSAVVGGGDNSSVVPKNEPPQTILISLNPSQRAAFIRLWNKVPAYLREIHFDFEESMDREGHRRSWKLTMQIRASFLEA